MNFQYEKSTVESPTALAAKTAIALLQTGLWNGSQIAKILLDRGVTLGTANTQIQEAKRVLQIQNRED